MLSSYNYFVYSSSPSDLLSLLSLRFRTQSSAIFPLYLPFEFFLCHFFVIYLRNRKHGEHVFYFF